MIVKENFPILLLFKSLMDEATAQPGKESRGGWPRCRLKDSRRGTEGKSETKPNPRVFYPPFPGRLTNITHVRKVIQ